MKEKTANKQEKQDKTKGNAMKNFEERLEKLESLGEKIKKPDIPLDEALAAFEDGVRLARELEKELEKVESRIEILTNNPDSKAGIEPKFDLFNENAAG